MTTLQLYVEIAAGCYGLSLAATFLPVGRRIFTCIFLLAALGVNSFAAACKYYQAWPMLPMYLGPVLLPVLMGASIFMTGRRHPMALAVHRIILAFVFMITAAAMFFPKDYYLPFIKSCTFTAHFFFWFGAVGRGCFMIAAAWALAALLFRSEGETGRFGDTENRRIGEGKSSTASSGSQCFDSACSPAPSSPRLPVSHSPLFHTTRWIVWGFAFFTLSMFSGELWSYLGWGTPVVWDDPAITTTMAAWFFYICWLHLHLTGAWSARSRSIFAACGAPTVFCLNILPELGPFRWLF